jgi:hypothetical protein
MSIIPRISIVALALAFAGVVLAAPAPALQKICFPTW